MADARYLAQWLPQSYNTGLDFSDFLTSSPRSRTTPRHLPKTRPPTCGFDTKLSWHDLPSCSDYIHDQGWSTASIPAAVGILPENLLVNLKLREILAWSLQNYDEIPRDDASTERDQDHPEHSLVESSGEPSAESNFGVAAPEASDDKTPSISVRAKSRRIFPLVTRLKQLRQDIASKVVSDASSPSHGSNNLKASLTRITIDQVRPGGECVSCFDDFPGWNMVHLKCSHHYCKPCLRELVMTAMKNEASFPPKCCLIEVPLKTILVCLGYQQREEFKEKSAEYAIPAGHRWYCPELKCGKWIRPETLHRDRRAPQICPHCTTRICSMCRGLAHGKRDCPQDLGLGTTLEIAEFEGWRRCYSCRTMVELATGCRHITCRCGAQFCYVCNAKWKTCKCTETDKKGKMKRIKAQRELRMKREEEERRIEAEEMAEALRQAEEIERQDALRRIEEERQQQLEQQLIRAQAEEARLLEEIAQRQREEEAERNLRQMLITSSKDECQAMMATLLQIIDLQHAMLMSSHSTQELHVIKDNESQRLHASRSLPMPDWLQDDVNKRATALDIRHQSEWEALLFQAENEEDEMFTQMQIQLRRKLNREQKERKSRAIFQKQHHQKTESLYRRQQSERGRFEEDIQHELETYQTAASRLPDFMKEETSARLEEFGSNVGCDRVWFELISTRRVNMLNEHKKLVLEQIEAGDSPTGLGVDRARQFTPFSSAINDRWTAPGRMRQATIAHLACHATESQDLYGSVVDEQTQTVCQPKLLDHDDSDALSRPSTRTLSTQRLSFGQQSIMDRPRPIVSRSSESTTSSISDALTPTPTCPTSNYLDAKTMVTDSPPILHLCLPNHSATSLSTFVNYDPNGSTTTLSPTTTPTSKYSSVHSHFSISTSRSSNSSVINEPSIFDTISAAITARHSQNYDNKRKGTGVPVLGGMFRGFGKKKETDEDEIRRRMSSISSVSVGDDGW